MPRAAPTPRRARRTPPLPTPPPAYSPTIDLTGSPTPSIIDLTADTDDDVPEEVTHAPRRAHPYRHTRRSLPATTVHTTCEGCVTRSQTRQAPTARDLLAIAEIAGRLPPAYTGITLRDAHDLAHGIASAMRHDPDKYRSLQQLNQDVREIWQELAE